MRDIVILLIILGSLPLCFFRPYFGVLMWVWVAYFNPHRFGYYMYNFPVASVIAVPTLIGIFFTRQVNRNVWVRETILLLVFWAWVCITWINATQVPIFADHIADGEARLITTSKVLLMSFIILLLVNTRKKLDGLFLVTALSFGLLAIKGSLFGIRTSGEFRVWGPPDSFVADNNDFGLALNMTLPMMFYMARDIGSKWLKRLLWLSFFCSVLAILLTYSRGALLGLAVVLGMFTWKSRHRLLGAGVLAGLALLVITFAPGAWMDRMSNFLHGNLDESAEGRLNAWHFSIELAKQYPITGGGFETFTPELFERITPGLRFAGPHSIYFEMLGEQGYVGLIILLTTLGSCFVTLRRLRRQVRNRPELQWISKYSDMLEICLMAFAVSGAFLPRAYFDLWFELAVCTALLKIFYLREVAMEAVRVKEPEPQMLPEMQEAPVT